MWLRTVEQDHPDWTTPFRSEPTQQCVWTIPREPAGRIKAVAHKAAVHELGHVLNIGENEPVERKYGDEVYSGNPNDPTVEWVEDTDQSQPVREWSIMADGSSQDQYLPPTNETYFAFSIEEVMTVSTKDTQVEDPS